MENTQVTNPAKVSYDVRNYVADANGKLRKRNSAQESGVLFTYCIKTFEQKEGHDNIVYDGRGKLEVTVGSEKPFVVEVQMSSLITYSMFKDSEKYLGVKFSGYTTSPTRKDIPFKLFKNTEGKYVLYFVEENGSVKRTTKLPNGKEIVHTQFKYRKCTEYLRYYEARK